jgi:aerobic-type carbon monoxide dehydrogenase small subunit (CoxS/CutS family)
MFITRLSPCQATATRQQHEQRWNDDCRTQANTALPLATASILLKSTASLRLAYSQGERRMSLTLKVNGKSHTVDVEPSTPLLYILRNDLGLQGPRFGCGLGQCGACTVIINGVATRSCITPVSSVKSEITTLEGIAKEGKLHPLQQAWIDEQVPQCGFCQNGQIMTAKALLDKNPKPTDAQIRQGMNGTLCRCMTYYRIQAAIKRAAKVAAADNAAAEKEVVA